MDQARAGKPVFPLVSILYSIILLTENAQQRGWLAFPGLDTWYILSRHPKTVQIFNAWEGVPSIKARKSQQTPFSSVFS